MSADDAGPDDRRVPPRPGPQPLGGRRPTGQDRPAVEEPLQVVGHFLRRRVAVGRILAECLQDDGLQLRGGRTVPADGRGGIVVGDLPDQGVAVAPLEGGPERQQFVERRPERIDVAAVIDDPAPGEDLLGAGVAQRAEQLPGDREPGIPGDLGQAEVGDPELPAEVQQQVARLDVAVHDPRLMGVLERERRLPAQPGHAVEIPAAVRGPLARDRRRGEHDLAPRPDSRGPGDVGDGRPIVVLALGRGWAGTLLIAKATQLADQRGEALPVDELHRVIVDAALAADRVHRHDLLVLHVRRREGLGLESLEAARVDGRGEREDLERDPPPQRDLLGLVDDPHPAPAHLAQEAKVAELADARGISSGSSRDGCRAQRRPPAAAAPEGRREPRHLVVAGEECLQVRPEVGVLRQEPAPVGFPALLERLDVGQEDLVPPLLAFGVAGEFMSHGPTPPGRGAARGAASARGRAGRRRPGVCGRSPSATSATGSPFR